MVLELYIKNVFIQSIVVLRRTKTAPQPSEAFISAALSSLVET